MKPRRDAVELAVIAAVSLAVYGPALSRYFVSEDFTILRVLWEGGFWRTAWEQLTGPWLGITFVKFYRPLSTLLLQLEVQVWGAWAPGFLATHFLVHLANAVLLHRIAGRLAARDGAVPFAAAMLFALYPLHPNAVVFVGSFATLFSATFFLASVLFFLRGLESGRRLDVAAALVSFAAALGCYEAAAVLPVLLLSADLLLGRTAARRTGWRSLLARQLPFFGLLAVYLVLRRVALGFAIGGYSVSKELFSEGGLADVFDRAGLDWARFFWPAYGPRPGDEVQWAALTVVLAGTLWSLVRLARGRTGGDGAGSAKLWLLAVIWIFLAQLPFRVADVVPGNGRYWYLSAAGLGLLVAAFAGGVTPRRWRAAGVTAAAALLAGGYLWLLSGYVGLHVEAGRQTREIQARLVEEARRTPGRLFVADHPLYEHGDVRVPVAQVFHWGLSDAVRPPFVERDARVYPLPRFHRRHLDPLLERPDLGRALRWQDSGLVPLSRRAGRARPKITLRSPADGELPEDFRVRFEAIRADRYRIVILARGHTALRPAEAGAGAGGLLEARMPGGYVTSMRRLYDDEIFWWIEGLDEAGRPVAFSELRTIWRAGP